MIYAVSYTIFALVMGGLGTWVAEQKNRSGSEGCILGILFGPFGVLIEALLPVQEPRPKKVIEPLSSDKIGTWRKIARWLLSSN